MTNEQHLGDHYLKFVPMAENQSVDNFLRPILHASKTIFLHATAPVSQFFSRY